MSKKQSKQKVDELLLRQKLEQEVIDYHRQEAKQSLVKEKEEKSKLLRGASTDSHGIPFPERSQEHAATKIQQFYRGVQARSKYKLRTELAVRREYEKKRQEKEEKTKTTPRKPFSQLDAATTIQKHYRGHLARMQTRFFDISSKKSATAVAEHIAKQTAAGSKPSTAESRRDDRPTTAEQHAATAIQARYRGHVARKEVEELQQQLQQTEEESDEQRPSSAEVQAATKIQSMYRGHQGRKHVEHTRQEAAATKIQSIYRGHRVRKVAEPEEKTGEESSAEAPEEPSDEPPAFSEEEERAAVRIQAAARGHFARKQLKHELEGPLGDDKDEAQEEEPQPEDDNGEITDAINISSSHPGEEIALKMMKDEIERGKDAPAPPKEQATKKDGQVKKGLAGLREDGGADQAEAPATAAAAVRIQASFRGYLARKTTLKGLPARKKKPAAKKPEVQQGMSEEDAAKRIQACMRGYNVKKEYEEKKKAAKAIQKSWRVHNGARREKLPLDLVPAVETPEIEDTGEMVSTTVRFTSKVLSAGCSVEEEVHKLPLHMRMGDVLKYIYSKTFRRMGLPISAFVLYHSGERVHMTAALHSVATEVEEVHDDDEPNYTALLAVDVLPQYIQQRPQGAAEPYIRMVNVSAKGLVPPSPDDDDEPPTSPKLVRVEVVPCTALMPFVGGFRHKKSMKEYVHAGTQTDRPPTPEHVRRKRELKRASRDTQTAAPSIARSVQCTREMATQMGRRDLFIDTRNDRIMTPKPYYDADRLHQLRVEKAIVIQSYVRAWFARRERKRLGEERRDQLDQLFALENERIAAQEEVNRREIERRMRPRTEKDFDVLYSELQAWTNQEAHRIRQADDLSSDDRSYAFQQLLDKETKLLQTIDRLRTQAAKENKKTRIDDTLSKMASQKVWATEEGGETTVETPFTVRARELKDLYDGLIASDVSVDERLEVLLHVKWTVKEFDCLLTRELVALIDREADLLNRGRPESSLNGLRKRIASMFLRFIETPEFNPEAVHFQRCPLEFAERPDIAPLPRPSRHDRPPLKRVS